MFTLSKTYRFEAAHQLLHHDGKCARLHGHSWVMTVEVKGEVLHTAGNKKGMLVDYGDISKVVKKLVEERLDHYHLNDTMGVDSPTSEFLARWVYEYLEPLLPGLSAVIVNETCTSECRYEPQRQ